MTRITLIGSHHYRENATKLFDEIIEREQVDAIAVELDEDRVEVEEPSYRDAHTNYWRKLYARFRPSPLKSLLQLTFTPVILPLVFLYVFGQKRLYDRVESIGGTTIHHGLERADELGINSHLIDRQLTERVESFVSRASKTELVKAMTAFGLAFMYISVYRGDVDSSKDEDDLDDLSEMKEAYPTLYEVFVNERDVYMAYQLKQLVTPDSASSDETSIESESEDDNEEEHIVAIVGAGHLDGITTYLDGTGDFTLDVYDMTEDPGQKLTQYVYEQGFDTSG